MWDVYIISESSDGYQLGDASGGSFFMSKKDYQKFDDERKKRQRKQNLKTILEHNMNEKELKYHYAYLDMSSRWAELSHSKRKNVGAIIVKDGQIISDGYNGTPSGMDNCCEDDNGETLWYVQHAEENAISKCAKHGKSCDKATLYLTHSPCKNCASLVYSSGIQKVLYRNEYKDTDGIDYLKDRGV